MGIAMSDHSRTRSIFAGWWVVAASFLEMFVTGVPFLELSIFMPSLEKEFGWRCCSVRDLLNPSGQLRLGTACRRLLERLFRSKNGVLN
jgi:hypothetical protein